MEFQEDENMPKRRTTATSVNSEINVLKSFEFEFQSEYEPKTFVALMAD